jgi:hypothetical protein
VILTKFKDIFGKGIFFFSKKLTFRSEFPMTNIIDQSEQTRKILDTIFYYENKFSLMFKERKTGRKVHILNQTFVERPLQNSDVISFDVGCEDWPYICGLYRLKLIDDEGCFEIDEDFNRELNIGYIMNYLGATQRGEARFINEIPTSLTIDTRYSIKINNKVFKFFVCEKNEPSEEDKKKNNQILNALRNKLSYYQNREKIIQKHRGKYVAYSKGSVKRTSNCLNDCFQYLHKDPGAFVTIVGNEEGELVEKKDVYWREGT